MPGRSDRCAARCLERGKPLACRCKEEPFGGSQRGGRRARGWLCHFPMAAACNPFASLKPRASSAARSPVLSPLRPEWSSSFCQVRCPSSVLLMTCQRAAPRPSLATHHPKSRISGDGTQPRLRWAAPPSRTEQFSRSARCRHARTGHGILAHRLHTQSISRTCAPAKPAAPEPRRGPDQRCGFRRRGSPPPAPRMRPCGAGA